MSTAKQRSTMPRRTEEFDFSGPPSSMKKPPAQRLSRIAQPIRKLSKASLGAAALSENRRSASTDRLNVVGGTPNTVRKLRPSKRSLSATPAASRTPLKSCENATSVPATVEKDRPPVDNRDWMAGQCERICDYLVTIPELPHEFVERRNLKAMSTKQFLLIMSHLFKQIGGSRYKMGNNNFIDVIMKTMAELEYPFTVNKSMLKTPNVPHSINHIIVMIGWLIQLAPAVDHKVVPLKTDANLLEDFSSAAYQEFFYERTQEGFGLWNLKREEEFGDVVQELTDRLVEARTNGLNQKQVGDRIAELEQELADINNRTIQHGREQSMDGLVGAINEQEKLRTKLTEEVKSLQRQANKAQEDYYLKQEDYYAKVKKFEMLKQEVNGQQLAAFERDELMNAISANKSLFTAKRLAVSTLEQASCDHQIAVSRLIKQKFSLIANLNTKLHQFADNLKPLVEFDPPTIDLKTENYTELLADLQTIQTQLTAIMNQQSAMYATISEQKSQLEHHLSDLQIQHASVEKALAEMTTRYEHLQQQRETLIGQLSSVNAENSQASHRKQDERHQMERELEKLREQCEQNRKAVERLAQDKQKLMLEKLERCQEMLREKKDFVAEITAQVEEIEAVMAGVERELGPEE
ncbi:kinetochore protein NDC80 homolog [Culex quinquefasciatus]|uniref:kinetochore protein NDC80 homolog n=1 Tax=Culex quinquefasciatus TaxID=7176 RepID=UPI0018E3EFB6|nr:kinetochore protein NDC80 homolog [Culex quinquefasciatus]